MRGRLFRRAATVAWFALAYVFLLAPIVVVIGASFSGADTGGVVISYVQFPPQHWTLEWYARIPGVQYEALALSLGLGLSAALAACALGIPAALGLVRAVVPGKPLIAALLRAPLQIPTVVIGIAFMQLYYLIGDLVGLDIFGSFAGLLLAHVFLVLPFVIGSVSAVLQRFNTRLEEAAHVLGASPWRTFTRVTLPLIMPGVYTGALYAFIVSFIDVPVSLFLAAPGTVTYPVELFHSMEHDFNPSALASASLVTVFSLLLLAGAQRLIGLNALLRSGAA
jgi:putative spermidine/putrescine transport system permease protein